MRKYQLTSIKKNLKPWMEHPEEMEFEYPSTSGWETIPLMVINLTTAEEDQNHTPDTKDTTVKDAIPDEDDETQLTKPDNLQYKLHIHKPTVKTYPRCEEVYDPFPDHKNLALQGKEAINLKLLLTQLTKFRTGEDCIVIKTTIQSVKMVCCCLRKLTHCACLGWVCLNQMHMSMECAGEQCL